MVGLTALAAIITFVILISWLGSFRLGGEGYTFDIQFKDVSGLLEGAPVQLRGVQVGKVEKLTATPEKVIVRAWIKYRATRIPKDAKFTIGTKGLIGEKYLEITPYENHNGDRAYINPGDLVYGKEPAKLEDLIASGQEVLSSLKELSGNLNDLFEDPQTKKSLKSIVLNLDETSKNLASATKEIDKFVKDPQNTKNLSDGIKNFNSSMQKLDKILSDVDKITGDPEVTKGVKDALKSFGGASKTLGAISLTEARFHTSLLDQNTSTPPETRLRPDIGLSFKNQVNQAIELELTDVGRASAIQAQVAMPLGADTRWRLGIIDSKVGVGADYFMNDERWRWGLSISDPVTPQGLINTLYWITPNYALQLEYRNNFTTGFNSFAGGIRYSP